MALMQTIPSGFDIGGAFRVLPSLDHEGYWAVSAQNDNGVWTELLFDKDVEMLVDVVIDAADELSAKSLDGLTVEIIDDVEVIHLCA